MLHVTRLTDRTGTYYLADLATELGPALHTAPEARLGSVPEARLGSVPEARLGSVPEARLGSVPEARLGSVPEARFDLAPASCFDLAPGAGLDLAPARPGWWTGAGAAGLGLAGPVEGRDLAAVLSGRSPATGRSLVLRQGSACGYDLTFTAPKSASVLFALGSPEVAGEVLSAHAGAVEAAMGYVARRAMAVRRGSGDERCLEPADGVVGAAFTHGVSRALDPHLHTHVVVANLGHGPDGRWTAVDGRGLFAHAPAAGHLYGAQLRHQLSSCLGVEWTARRNGSYEVTGIDPVVLGGFSARQAEIRSHLAERSLRRRDPGGDPHPTRRAARAAWAATRDPKGPPPAPGDLARRWGAQAAALGLATEDLGAVLGRPGGHNSTAGHGVGGPRVPEEPAITGKHSGRPGGHDSIDEHRFAARLAVSPHATAARRDAVAAWAGALWRGAPAADVDRCADQLAGWGDAVGVGEPRQALAAVVPTAYQLRALGPRPASPRSLGVWLAAATAMAEYRSRWGVTDRVRPLGVEGSGGELASMGARQLADHLATARRLADACRQLGRAVGRDAEPPYLDLGRD